jgi:hypothetical protein
MQIRLPGTSNAVSGIVMGPAETQRSIPKRMQKIILSLFKKSFQSREKA